MLDGLEVKRLLDSVANIHQKVANDVWPMGATLHCAVCEKHDVKISSMDCSHYLRTGWPQCCGQTMMLESNDHEGLRRHIPNE